MRNVLKWLIAVPLVVLAIAFSIPNAQSVDFTWSPFHDPASLPLYLLCLIFAASGFLIGALITWLGTAPVRSDRRQQRKTIRTLERELVEANELHRPGADHPEADHTPERTMARAGQTDDHLYLPHK